MSSRSLKGLTPSLARLLGTTAPRIYERQQILLRAGILASKAGRGPGSGTAATAPSLALLLIAILGSETLGQTEVRTRELAAAAPVGGVRCPLTDAKTFVDAVANILSSRERSARVIEITVSRTAARATITYRDRETRGRRTSEFIGPNSSEPVLRTSATLDGSAVKQIAADVVDILLAPDDPEPVERPRRRRMV
jgi:hypothetical protein